MAFTLRDQYGNAMPLLSSAKNREVDAAALIAAAPPGSLRTELEPMLTNVASLPAETHQGAPTARYSFRMLSDRLLATFRTLPAAERQGWERVLTLASVLVENSVLWARVTGWPWDRFIVKWAFDYPYEPSPILLRRVLVSLSWSASRFVIPVPSLGERGSLHLDVRPPDGLDAVHAELNLYPEPPAPWRRPARPDSSLLDQAMESAVAFATRLTDAIKARARAAFASVRPGEAPEETASYSVEPPVGETFVRVEPDRAYLYVSGLKRQYALAFIYMAPARDGLIRTGLIVASGIAILITALAAAGSPVSGDKSATVTTLVLVPGVLGFIAARAGEHPATKSHLQGVRILLLFSGALPVSAAIALVGFAAAARTIWIVLSVLAWTIVAVLAISWILPVKNAPEELGVGGQ
jgi:hypothetical protein